MKKYCINLDKRKDRKDLFLSNNTSKLGTVEFLPAYCGEALSFQDLEDLGIRPDYSWRDPILKRRLTKGEMGCLASHVHLWNMCVELNKPIIIFEDDAVVNESYSEEEIESLFSRGFGLVYLGYREMGTAKDFNEQFVVPDFAYLTHAYAVTPKACKELLKGLDYFGGIPADELIPRCFLKVNPIAYKKQVATQLPRSEMGTDIEPTRDEDYFPFEVTKVYTVATDVSKANMLLDSAVTNDVEVILLGTDREDFDMSGKGGGIKVNLLREALANEDENTLIMFLDGYDTFITEPLETIKTRYMALMSEVVFSAEQYCWPDSSLASQYPDSHTPFKFLNSGTFIGRAGYLRMLLEDSIEDTDDDQEYFTKKFLSGHYDISLDYEAYIFQTNNQLATIKNNRLYSPLSNCYSCIYHGNGGASAKEVLNRVYSQYTAKDSFYIGKNLTFIKPEVKHQLDTDMYVTSFLTEEMCNYLIKKGNENNTWEPLPGDLFPAQEIRVTELGLWDDFSGVWDELVGPLYSNIWHPTAHYGLRDAFVMKYTLDSQKKLSLHNDASLVTGSVKLNDNYQGADLWFPRQKVSNKDVAVGDMILFPGQVTHGHECQELISGEKYSLTMWTKRKKND